MHIKELGLKGIFEITPKILKDSRGLFAETYLSSDFEDKNLQTVWIQENQSFTAEEGTIRGLHFQVAPFSQTKLIRVPVGKIFDVCVDLRIGSPTYGRWDSLEISGELCNAVYIPRGFAHGFCTLEKDTIVQYKVDNPYSPDYEKGIKWNDPDLNISWKLDGRNISERDRSLPPFCDFSSPFSLRNTEKSVDP